MWHRQERGYGTFTREITLPTMIDVDKIDAGYAQGVLRFLDAAEGRSR